ncbi:beta-lactamase [Exophiala aquamarina CBS 119918]|uniref:Beta-lactamase n=1 Tax=Exophiala aquamarina CBS 119918 TaxID=1182545 RepID=A0A072PVA7_9EURO|nr:beta-lactamase [Exophiala aquamarina CBS 119918]KEF59510.1 beta-lactamase [Exophiala aquamarina CBS 119918]
MSSKFESKTSEAIKDGILSGAACVAGRKDGTIFYQQAFGRTGAEPDAGPMKLDTVMWIASCTKLLTSISAMKCVEKGLLELDAPITKVLTDFEHPNILDGFDDWGKPKLRRSTKAITLRHLLTHTSGFGYIGMNQSLTQFAVGIFSEPPSFGLNSPKYSCQVPLVAEPGETWEYGVGLEWAGRMVERVSGKTLGEYMRENIFDVLGMTFTTFHPWDNPEIMAHMGGRTWRDHTTGKFTIDRSGWFPESERPEQDYGGGGSYSCALDYVKVLMSLLMDDAKLLKPETVETFFAPQVEDTTSLQSELTAGPISIGATNGLPKDDCKFNYGLGGALCTNSIPGHFGRGMMFWSGLPNSFWFIDREAGSCGMYLSHIFPPGDGPTQALNAEFQRFVYSASVSDS